MNKTKYIRNVYNPIVKCPKCGHKFPGNLKITTYDGTEMLTDKLIEELEKGAL